MERHWTKLRSLHNKINTMIRNSKQHFYGTINDKLKSESLSSKDWWSTLKTFISPNHNNAIPQLNLRESYIPMILKKQVFLIITFKGKQSLTIEILSFLNYLTILILQVAFKPQENEAIVKILKKTYKAFGPDGLIIRSLKELSN